MNNTALQYFHLHNAHILFFLYSSPDISTVIYHSHKQCTVHHTADTPHVSNHNQPLQASHQYMSFHMFSHHKHKFSLLKKNSDKTNKFYSHIRIYYFSNYNQKTWELQLHDEKVHTFHLIVFHLFFLYLFFLQSHYYLI